MKLRGAIGPMVTVTVVVAMAWGAVPPGVLSGHRGVFTALVWGGVGVTGLVVALAGWTAWTRR